MGKKINLKEICCHPDFECFCNVNRLTKGESKYAEKPIAFTVDIQVKCKKCEKPFVFIGLPMGVLHESPSMGVFGYEARLPIKPSG